MRLPSVGGLQRAVGGGEILRVDDGLRATTQQFGAVGSELLGERVELGDEVVVELDEHFAAGHDHTVDHMVTTTPGNRDEDYSPTVTTSLPKKSPDAMRAWASAIASNGYTESTIGSAPVAAIAASISGNSARW